MKKVFKKIISTIAITLLVLVSGLVTVVFSPQILFANKIEHKHFSVYSDAPVDELSLKTRLDDAYALIEYSELHDTAYHFDVLLAYNHFFNKIESLQGTGPIARATAGYITFKVPINPKQNYAVGRSGKVNLTWLLAHEMVHNLQANRYGLLNFSPLKHPPMWKLEGYPEYIAKRSYLKDERYSLRSEVARYLKLRSESDDGIVEVTNNHFMPLYYYKGRLMVEYLIGVKGLSYDQILKDDRSEQEVFDELLHWTTKGS